jgi:hypothetical protein
MANPGAPRPADKLFPERRPAIQGNRCMPEPIGCGKEATSSLKANITPMTARCTDCQLTLCNGDAYRVCKAARGHIDAYVKGFNERHTVILVAFPDKPLNEAYSE